MAVLKKIPASTLMETLVASVLLVIVFMIASMILNNLFSNTIKTNRRGIESYINELQYQYKNNKIRVPYTDDYKKWEIEVTKEVIDNQFKVIYQAINIETKQELIKTDNAQSNN